MHGSRDQSRRRKRRQQDGDDEDVTIPPGIVIVDVVPLPTSPPGLCPRRSMTTTTRPLLPHSSSLFPGPPLCPALSHLWLDNDNATSPLLPPSLMMATMQPPLLQYLSPPPRSPLSSTSLPTRFDSRGDNDAPSLPPSARRPRYARRAVVPDDDAAPLLVSSSFPGVCEGRQRRRRGRNRRWIE